MTHSRLFASALALTLGLVVAACDDDDDDIDAAAARDAAAPRDSGARDAGGGGGDAGEDAQSAFSVILTLTPKQEVPVCDGAGDEAMGSATIAIDAANTRLEIVDLTHSGLSGPATAAHIHVGDPGEAGPIVLDLGTELTSPIDRTFTADDYPASPPEGAAATFEGFLQQVRAGETYLNVHTADCMMGEIRDQID